MRAFKAIVRTIIGLVFGLLSGLILMPAFSAFWTEGNDTPVLAWVVVLIGGLLGAFAPTIRRAFGRGFLILGASTLVLPLSMLLLSGRVAGDMVAASEGDAATAIGAGLAGVMMTGASAVVGFIFGAIFLITGLVLVLGGRREVVIAGR